MTDPNLKHLKNPQPRQGDLLFIPVKKTERDSDPSLTHDETGILARGESTGHNHRIQNMAQVAFMVVAGAAYLKRWKEKLPVAYIDSEKEVKILHNKHAPADLEALPEGYTWSVRRQTQNSPEGWQALQD